MDEKNVGPLSGLPPTAPQGPRRRAPRYYAGETYGRRHHYPTKTLVGGYRRGFVHYFKLGGRRVNHPDIERYPNGVALGIRDKGARRLVRYALKRRYSSVERGLKMPRALNVQAREIVSGASSVNPDTRARIGKSARAAKRLVAAELALHQPVWVPSKKEIRAMRTAKRKEKRAKAKANKKMLRGIAAP